MNGKFYIVATPIGNLKDITLRALEVLKEVDMILCEDTRHTRKLLNHYQIEKPLLSVHEHNETRRCEEILKKLKAGSHLALVSDAGTPLISDPGYPLIQSLIQNQISFESIPGPCAAIQGLVLSGLPTDRFLFIGFLPNKSAARRRKMEELQNNQVTLVFYESTHRIQKFLRDAFQIFGERPFALVRESTKRFEEVIRGKLSDSIQARSWKGEFVVVIAGKSTKSSSSLLEQH